MRDRRTLAPMVNREITLQLDRSGRMSQETVRTDASGVAHMTQELSTDESPGTYSVRAMIGDTAHQIVGITVGRRTQERLMADLEWDQSQYTPGQAFAPRVRVSAPSGAVVRNARVTLHVGDRDPIQAMSDGEGIARFTTETPAYLSDETGTIVVRAEVRHSAHGTANTSRTLRLAMPLSLNVRGIAGAGALVPEIDSQLFVHVLDAAGDPPEAGTRVTVRGPGVRAGVHTTDEHGLVALDVRLRRGDASRHQSGECRGQTAASFDVEIEGPRARHARFCVPVWHEARVRPVAEEIVRAPGQPLVVRVRRRPDARRALVSVSLVRNGMLLESRTTRGDQVRFDTPSTLGLHHVVTRVVSDPARGESAESYPALEPILIRPAEPSFPEAAPRRPVYSIGSEATVDVQTRPGSPGWLAIDVRDLAQHGGERPFQMFFLRAQVRKALFDPATPALDRLARASLGTLSRPSAPPRGRSARRRVRTRDIQPLPGTRRIDRRPARPDRGSERAQTTRSSTADDVGRARPARHRRSRWVGRRPRSSPPLSRRPAARDRARHRDPNARRSTGDDRRAARCGRLVRLRHRRAAGLAHSIGARRWSLWARSSPTTHRMATSFRAAGYPGWCSSACSSRVTSKTPGGARWGFARGRPIRSRSRPTRRIARSRFRVPTDVSARETT